MIANSIVSHEHDDGGFFLRQVEKFAPLWLALLAGAYTVSNLFQLSERFVDYRWNGFPMGIFSQWLWNLGRGEPISSILGEPVWGGSVPLILMLLAPVYRWIPEPYVLSVIQTLFIAAGCCGVYAVGACYLRRSSGLFLAALYCLYPPLILLNAADFHPVVLASSFLIWSVYAMEKRRRLLFVFCFAPALLCDIRVLPVAVVIAAGWIIPRQKMLWRAIAMSAGLALMAVLSAIVLVRTGHAPFLLYGTMLTPVVFWTVSAGMAVLIVNLKRYSPLLTPLAYALLAGIFLTGAILTPMTPVTGQGNGHLPVRKSVLNWLLAKVPSEASVLSPPLFLPKLANRQELHVFGMEGRGGGAKDTRTDYALMDFGPYLLAPDAGRAADQSVSADMLGQIRSFFSHDWYPVENVGSVVLFQAGVPEAGAALYGSADLESDAPYLTLNATAQDELELVGFTMESEEDNIDIVRFLFYWKKLKDSQRRFGMFFNIMSEEGRVVHTIKKPLCYQLYPFEKWKVGEVVKEQYAFVVPEHLVHSTYEVHFGIYDVATNRLARLKSPREEAIDRWGLAKLIALDAI